MLRIMIIYINFIVGVIAFFLGFRFLFRLFGASENAPFVRWLYATTEPLLNPFSGIFPAPALQGRYVVEFTTLVALLVYMFIGYLFVQLVMAISNYTERGNF
jgi:uncharacterized protein YggT (Ycf19 family)